MAKTPARTTRKASAAKAKAKGSQAGGIQGASAELAHPHGPAHTVHVGLVQTHASGEAADNIARTLKLIDQAAKKGAQVVCTQELFTSTYFCQEEDAHFFDLAEPIPGPTTKALQAKARQHGIVIVGSLFEKRARGLYHNTAVVIDADGTLLGSYRKMHIPDDPRFYEKFYFTPGDATPPSGGFKAFDTKFGRIGTLICWDQWYPEAARLTALQGADILFYPTAIGTWLGEMEYKETQHQAWHTIQRAHAVANGCFVVAVNRIGREDELQFWGRSFVARPMGIVAAEAGEGEEVLVVPCDLKEIEAARRGWPFQRDRRIDAYGDLTRRYVD
ncbi:MAG: N-carbamoylputrescine amidase [Thermoplasmata archaeon]|nr:N-carbamoylputrescine amidase [Thermoplasmata archaeon]